MISRVAAKLFAQALRLAATGFEHLHDENEPAPEEKVDTYELELERTREQMRRNGHQV